MSDAEMVSNCINLDKREIVYQIASFRDIYNLYPWQQVAYCVDLHWNFVKCNNHKCPKCNNNLISAIYHPNQYVESAKIVDLNICTFCQSQFDSNLHSLQNNRIIDADYIRKINPFTWELTRLLLSLGYELTLHKELGESGVILFQYEGATLGIRIDATYAINIFYPNWAIIPASKLTQREISAIQSYNFNHLNCIYWLFRDGNYTFSTNVIIDINLINENAIASIKSMLSDLIKSKQYFINNDNQQHILLSSETLHAIKATLKSCGCNNIFVDDENDVHFKWNESSMYLHAIDHSTYKVVHHLVMLEDVTEEKVTHVENIDQEGLSIQWSNMIWPAKCTFYKPDERHISATVTILINKMHFEKGHVKFICRRFQELVSFFDDCLFDLLYGTESGCEIIQTLYQPEIDNF